MVLQAHSQNYFLRLLGLVISNVVMLGLMHWGIILLLQQDQKWGDRQAWQELMQVWFFQEKLLPRAIISGLRYAQPAFHPSQKNNQALAAKVLSSP